MIVFAIIVFKTTALNRSATGPGKFQLDTYGIRKKALSLVLSLVDNWMATMLLSSYLPLNEALIIFYFVPTTPSGTVTLFQLYHNREFISWSFNVQHHVDTAN